MRRPLLLALAALFFALIFILRIGEEMDDFEVNYRAGARLLAGENLYRTADGHYMFKYFPSSALLYVPLSLLPLGAAKALWYALTVACSVLLFVVSKRLVWGRERAPWYLLALPPLVLAKFVVVELKLGQINTLVTLVLLGMVCAKSEARAGAWWGLATAMKPYGLIFLPYYAVRRRIVSLGSGLAVLLGAFLLPSLFYGFGGNVEIHRRWFRTLSESTPNQLGVADNISILGFAAKWSLSPWLAAGIVLALGALMLWMIHRGRDLARASVLEVAALLLLIPLVSPLGWDYQLVTSVLAMTLLARHGNAFSPPARILLALDLALIGLSVYDVMGRS
ncbi:MAG: glycosyltransferase family 87 protein, partial [Vicinamibacteria bacterium]